MQNYITIHGVHYGPHSEEERLVFLISKIAHLEQEQHLQSQNGKLLAESARTSDTDVGKHPVITSVQDSKIAEAGALNSQAGVSLKEHKKLMNEYKKLLKASKAVFRKKQLVLKLLKKHEETQMKAAEKRNQTNKAANPGFIESAYKPIIYDNLYNLLNLLKHSTLTGIGNPAKPEIEQNLNQESGEEANTEDAQASSEETDNDLELPNQTQESPAVILPPPPTLTTTQLAPTSIPGSKPLPAPLCTACTHPRPLPALSLHQSTTFYFQHLKTLAGKPVCFCGK